MRASQTLPEQIETATWPSFTPHSVVWTTPAPLAWAIICQVLLIALVGFGFDLGQAVHTPLVLVLAASGLLALVVPALRRPAASEDAMRAGPAAVTRQPVTVQAVTAGDARSPVSAQPGPHSFAAEPNVVPASAALVSQMCHELRTPLNAVIGFSSLMAREIHGPVGHPRYQEYLDHIVESSHRLLRSADATLALTSALSRPTGQNRQSVALATAIAEAADGLGAALGDVARAFVLCDEASTMVRADRAGLVEAIAHLLRHAAAATPAGDAPARWSCETQGDCCRLRLDVPHARSGEPGVPLPVLMAHMLLDLQGIALQTSRSDEGCWSATLTLPLAASA